MFYKIIKLTLITLFITSCAVSSPTENDIKNATNELFKAFKTTPVESISNLKCTKSSGNSTYDCQYSTTMADGKILESKGVFIHANGRWERTN